MSAVVPSTTSPRDDASRDAEASAEKIAEQAAPKQRDEGSGDAEFEKVPPARRASRPSSRLPLGREGKHLSSWVRVLLFLGGWLLVLLGIVGWFVPILHGWLTLFAGAAVLSLVSEAIFRLLRRLFRRWPWAWRKVLKMRRWMLRRLPLRGHNEESVAEPVTPQPAAPE